MGLTDFSKIRKNKGARRQSYQQLSILTTDRDGEVTKRKIAGNFLVHFVCPIETWTGEIFSIRPYYGQMPNTSYLQDLTQEPPFWPGLSPEQRTPESHLPLSYARSSPASARGQRQVIICCAHLTIFRSLK